VADHLAELARAGELRVDVGGVDVARHHREQVDVFGAEGADQSVSPMAISSNVRFWMKS
jgi:hypothetical protein